MTNQIQSDEELDQFMEDVSALEIDRKRWQLDYYLKNRNTDLLDQIILEEGC
jgi:hypothetical protein